MCIIKHWSRKRTRVSEMYRIQGIRAEVSTFEGTDGVQHEEWRDAAFVRGQEEEVTSIHGTDVALRRR